MVLFTLKVTKIKNRILVTYCIRNKSIPVPALDFILYMTVNKIISLVNPLKKNT